MLSLLGIITQEAFFMKHQKIEVNRKYERLFVISLFLKNIGSQNKTFALCKCDCGKETVQVATSIIQGKIKSCGCYKAEKASERTIKRNITHDKSYSRLYRIFAAMKTRCYNTHSTSYNNYGGRGIKIDKDWMNDFQSFYDWSIANNYEENLSIDRIDVNGNYEPKNCRWVDNKTQSRNRRNNRQDTIKITAFGETQAVGNWLQDSRCKVKSVATICYRIGSGWTPEDAISKPSGRK